MNAPGYEAKCDFCDCPAIAVLDNEQLCQRHADLWCRAEEESRRQYDDDNSQLGVGA